MSYAAGYVGTVLSQNELPAEQHARSSDGVEINPPKTACGCLCGGAKRNTVTHQRNALSVDSCTCRAILGVFGCGTTATDRVHDKGEDPNTEKSSKERYLLEQKHGLKMFG